MIEDEDEFFSNDDRTEKQKYEDNLKWMRFLRKGFRINKIQNIFKDEFIWIKTDGGLTYDHFYEVKRK